MMANLSFASTYGILKTVLVQILLFKIGLCEIEYNNVNPDGSFSFRHSNDDIGSYYHSVAGNPDNSIRGRYGSRNPSNGRVEETVYSAGPRGFRVNGPQVHRKMDLSQIPRGPIGSADDPLADPYDDPTYSFGFKTPVYSRDESSDSSGRIRGLYSYFDDIGEKHTVRYAAGAGTGFEVLNSVPDNPTTLAYRAPLYKAPKKTRGKISVQRGGNGRYKFIATGPDHRRSEVSGPDGVVRGAYSYLDDKGVQRTVEYEAGAGIGYRVLHSTVGRGSHLNTLVPNLGINDVVPREFLQTSSSGRIRPKDDDADDDDFSESEDSDYGKPSKTSSSSDEGDAEHSSRGGTRYKSSSAGPSHDDEELYPEVVDKHDSTPNTFSKDNTNKFGSPTRSGSQSQNRRGKKPNSADRLNGLSFDDDLSSIPPIITSNRRILEIGREQDWKSGNRDSTIIKNVGKWYVGLSPGQSVRAHVQNIDILPIGGRNISPSEALRRDELSEISNNSK